MEQDLISVIIPLYNTEKYIERCINSIMENSYKNLEVIVVDDGSTDGGVKIVKNLQEQYSNLRLVPHEKNMGLFQARITGFEASKGKYITYVDSDDYVTVDWFRLLHKTITENKSDIAVGQFIYDFDGNFRSYANLDPLRQSINLKGEDCIKTFVEQQCSHYSWHIVVTKLYKRELWQSALKDLKAFSKENPKLVMCEDLAFSSALWSRATSVSNFTTGAYYHYFRHTEQSTQVVDNREKNIKKIENILSVLKFFEKQLKQTSIFDELKPHLEKWKVNYAQIYYRDLKGFKSNLKFYTKLISEKFNLDQKQFTHRPAVQEFFYDEMTTIKENVFGWEQYIKSEICSPKTKVVSFDIFDTLILRPFYYPTDLFFILEHEFIKLFKTKAYYNFAQIRIDEESRAREVFKINNTICEEITLDDIYNQIAEDYGFDRELLEQLKQKELELEYKFCYVRKYGKELFELAKQQGKTVVIASDMYLPKEFIEKLLAKNGYKYDKLYLSSDIKVGKYSSNMFKYMINDLKVKPKEIIHIGDNWFSDVENAQKHGINGNHLPKTMDLYHGWHAHIYAGNLCGTLEVQNQTHDIKIARYAYLGYRCSQAIIANKLFDNPFLQYDNNTNYNADPYVLGYAALGPYLYSITDWIIKNALEQNSKTIHFIARDGYLPMLALDIFKKFNKELPKSNYLYLSRKSTLTTDIYSKADLYSLSNKLNPFNYTPAKLFKTFKPFMFDSVEENAFYEAIHIDEKVKDMNFTSKAHFDISVNKLSDMLDFKKINDSRSKLKTYFGKIVKENDILFDIGYSGRQELCLTNLLGFPVNSLYIHANSEMLDIRKQMAGFETKLFFEHKPKITGVVREHVFMKLAPSTIGYKEVDGKLEPEFEEYKSNVQTEIMTKTLQGAALDFVEDFLTMFEGYIDRLHYRREDFTFTFEHYLHFAKPKDRNIFKCLKFEDDFGLGESVNAVKMWENELRLADLAPQETWINPNVYEHRKKPFSRKVLDFVLPKGTKRREYFRHIYCNMTNQIYVSPFEQKPKKNKKK